MPKTAIILVSMLLSGLIGCTPDTPTDLSRIAGWRGAAPNSPETFRFVILSDRTGGHIPGLWAQAVAETNRLKPDFVMFVGDLIEGYTNDEKKVRREWAFIDAITQRLDAPFFYCPGNHDVIPDTCRKIYTELHGVNGKAWYSFDYRGCHFLISDSSAMIGKDKKLADEQWVWLEKDLTRANEVSDHVFVFIHHPMYYGRRKPHWKRLRAMLDAKKTTVFSGHWHSPLSYDLTDGVPYYLISATAAGSGGAPKNPNRMIGEFQSYAHVSVTKGKPTISFIALGEVLPHDYIDRSVVMRLRTLRDAAVLGSTTKAGGKVLLKMPNTTDTEVACTLTWTGGDDWFADGKPKDETLTIPAGKTVERTYRIGPSRQGTPTPVLDVRYDITAEGRTKHIGRKLPLRIVATLTARRVKDIAIDGKLDDWAGAPVHITNTRERVKGSSSVVWSGPKDCSYETRIGYDDKNLYLAIDVTDDATVTEGAGRTWQRDSVKIVWDPRVSAKRDGKFTGPCREMLVPVPAGSQKAAFGVYPPDTALVSAIRIVCRRREGGYTFELAIPFSAIGKDFKPAAGQTFGLEIVVHDKDKTPAQAITGMVLSGGTDTWRTTTGYAVVKFR